MLMYEWSHTIYLHDFTPWLWYTLQYYELGGKVTFGGERLLPLSFAQHHGVSLTEIFSSLLFRGLKQSLAEGFVKSQITWFPSHPALGNFTGDFTVKMDSVWHVGVQWSIEARCEELVRSCWESEASVCMTSHYNEFFDPCYVIICFLESSLYIWIKRCMHSVSVIKHSS